MIEINMIYKVIKQPTTVRKITQNGDRMKPIPVEFRELIVVHNAVDL